MPPPESCSSSSSCSISSRAERDRSRRSLWRPTHQGRRRTRMPSHGRHRKTWPAVDPVGGRIKTSREPGLHPGLLGRSSGSDKNVRSQDIWRGSKCGNRPSRDNRRKKDPSSGSGSNHGERGTLKRCGRANGRNVRLYLANSAIRG
jgi:hypothetical protein